MSTNIAATIDHTILKPDATKAEVLALCEEAKKYQFVSVCVNSCHVAKAAIALQGSGVKVCTVVGFPLGAATTASKTFEAIEAIKNGATEIDMVVNVGAVKDKDYALVTKDIEEVVNACHPYAMVKVIIETCLLTDQEKTLVSECCVAAGADFVKTSTGFSTAGAQVEDIRLIRKTIGNKAFIKASGGIRTLEQAKAMLEAGADRLGCSKGVEFMEEA